MSWPHLHKRTWALLAVLAPMLALFAYVALSTGLLAPVPVTVATVESRAIAPSLFGVGTVEARASYRIGPTFAGRLKRVEVQVGDHVKAGQLLGEMNPVDLDERIRSQEAAVTAAEAGLQEASARLAHARHQASRYEQLLAARSTSEELSTTKRHELQVAEAAAGAARENVARARSERDALLAQRGNLRLVAPAKGIVVAREIDPGTTVVAGQAVVEVVDPDSLWINVRFDQISAGALAAGLAARIELRSHQGQPLSGQVLRVEPKADAVTEETLAKVLFDGRPHPLPALGELAEVTVQLPPLPPAPVIPNAAIRREGGKPGVWRLTEEGLRFTPVRLGAADLDGRVQVREGLRSGDGIVTYSEKSIAAHSRIKVVEQIAGGTP